MPGAGAGRAAVAAGGGDAERADSFVAPDAPGPREAARVSVLGQSAESAGGGEGCAVLGGVRGLDCELPAFAGRAVHGLLPLDLCLLNYI